MPFKRQWDNSCPKVWKTWESDGVTWVIQDLDPQDDDEARHLLLEHLVTDEVLCIESKMLEDELSMEEISELWKELLAERTTLACYAEENGKRTLAAANCCVVTCQGEKDDILDKLNGEAVKNVLGAMEYLSGLVDVYKHYGVDKVLYGMGLVVRKDYRGAKLGSRVLAAREPLCTDLGVKASSTVFSGPASQKSAARAGFTDLAAITLTQLADAGFQYPRDGRVIKLMGKKFAQRPPIGAVVRPLVI